jgi:hypothetical protein
MTDDGPPDPFRDGQLDWGPLAANNFSFFAAHLAAGFTEAQALDLTGRYLSFVISVVFASQTQHGAGGAGESD